MNFSKIIARKISIGALAGLIGFSALAVFALNVGKLSAANNGFAFDLLKQIAQEQTNKNIFISPFSVSTALQMVSDGAAGETKAEMQRVLKTDGLPPAELNKISKNLNQSLKLQKKVTLDLADGIWYQKGFHLKPHFVSDNKNYFRAELSPVDFANPKSADIINDWAEKKTRGKIKNVVAFPFPPLTRMILANAIYFKGKWAEPFKKNQTKPRDFYLAGGEMEQAPMMSQHRHFGYQKNSDFQAVRLGYAGRHLEMILFLPDTNSNPQKMLGKLDIDAWQNEVLPQFSDREGTVVFPKFRINYDVLLNKSIQALGIRQAFSSAADFSAMANEPLCIGQVKQKSFVEVNEEGTEAAAVTGIALTALGPEPVPQPPFEMIVNRPFFFVITDEQTQAILFMGIVNDPTK